VLLLLVLLLLLFGLFGVGMLYVLFFLYLIFEEVGMLLLDNEIECVFVIVVYFDDIDFGVFGTIVGFVCSGLHVIYLLCTFGD